MSRDPMTDDDMMFEGNNSELMTTATGVASVDVDCKTVIDQQGCDITGDDIATWVPTWRDGTSDG